ncbi:hypothetical protein RF819_10485 [Rhodoferax fermentans]|uniref:Type I restriction modification DNA specificity domain-containing protein n=1 Tax=Rhodoferax fermentans TaxID=28066 RepID=A0A1T1ASZ5_RHOFE|nr:hypothetical protein RF819_10485 [Rhodoferax fermentans]
MARLRELILTLAVQGKLVPQDPGDEPASELLKKIRVEKDRLIAAGKIKRDKPLAEITEEEKPFGLPVGWKWARFGDLALISSGVTLGRKTLIASPLLLPYLRVANVQRWHLKLSSIKNVVIDSSELDRFQLVSGDLLITEGGDWDKVGRTAIWRDELPTCLHQNHVFKVRGTSAEWNPQWAQLFLNSPVARAYFAFSAKQTTNLASINMTELKHCVFPLPPLAEQSRIVTRVEELMRLCDALEVKGQLEAAQHAQLVATLLGALTDSDTPAQLAENWQRVACYFDLLLDRPQAVDALEQTILQLAVRGLLVPQDPQDEPASALLQKIRAEKDQLIAQGKIKRDKPLPPVAEDEQPFALPPGWCWARFPELGEFGRGKSKHRPRNDPALFNPPKYPLIQTGEVSRAKGVVQEVHSYYSDLGLEQSRMWPKGTLCITIAANIAESATLGFDSCFPDSVVGFVPARAMGNVEYFLLFVETAKADLLAFAPATAQKNINLEILSSLLIPLPPLNELARIVTRVTQLRHLCAELRARLAASQSTQAQLAEALVDSVDSGVPVLAQKTPAFAQASEATLLGPATLEEHHAKHPHHRSRSTLWQRALSFGPAVSYSVGRAGRRSARASSVFDVRRGRGRFAQPGGR